MGKECFTCANKKTTELTQDQRKQMRAEAINNGEKYPSIPELIFHCAVTGKQIKQTDPACNDYKLDKLMEEIRVDIAKTARKLRKEL